MNIHRGAFIYRKGAISMDYDLVELRQRLHEMLVNLMGIRDNIEILMDRLPLYSVEDIIEELHHNWLSLEEQRSGDREEHGIL